MAAPEAVPPSSRELLLLIVVLVLVFPSISFAFSVGFYTFSCPSAELIVRDRVRAAASEDPTIPAKLLRLLFHDCFVEGCDASVLLEGEETERADPANTSLGGFQVIESAKGVLEMFCPGIVSCADVLALAARDAVVLAGGPEIQIPTGRRDGTVSKVSNVRPNIIDTSFTLDQMNNLFTSKGLSLDDLVVLSGAHTIGSAHCGAITDRIQMDSKGNLTFIAPSLDHKYAMQLAKRCAAAPTASVSNDPNTSFLFDNQYYKNLMAHKGLFQSDSVLFDDQKTRNLVDLFANDGSAFIERWGESFLKLANVGVKVDGEGEIRQSCSTTNG
ncbi:Peroxidase 18 [Ancistrocladus abbreviatus]